MSKFKVGQPVYIPRFSGHIYILQETPKNYDTKNRDFPICINDDGDDDLCYRTFNINGFYDGAADTIPEIIHATQENYELLSKLYPNVTFEPPPKRKEPKEIIKAMLASGAIFIPCLVVDYDDNRILDYKKATRHSSSVLIYGISENGRFLSTNPHCSSYKYAVPFDIETGKVIIDFVDGEVVLESENE